MSYDIIQRSRDSEFIELSYCKNIDADSHKEYSIDDSLHTIVIQLIVEYHSYTINSGIP